MIIEAALVLPLIFFFIMGAIDFGFLELKYSQVSSGARDGARVGILQYFKADDTTSADYAAIDTAVRSRLAGTPVTSVTVVCRPGLTIFSTTKSCASAEVDVDTIEVQVAWNYVPLTFVGSTFFGSSKSFTTTARMTIVGRPT